MQNDPELLRRYAEEHAEDAFAELVRRHINLVYGVALRRLGVNGHAASDVTQQVFIRAARHARALSRHTSVTGWLHTATRNVASNALRDEHRRRERESSAVAMADILAPEAASNADWEQLRPVLDAAMDELGDRDRDAVLLRFFEKRPFADVGEQLQIGENAARMRVERAVEKLRALLVRRGITSTTAALGAALTHQTGAMVPAGLAASVTNAALFATPAGLALPSVFSVITTHKIAIITAAVTAAMLTLNVSALRANRRLHEELSVFQQDARAFDLLRTENRQLMDVLAQRTESRQLVTGLKEPPQRARSIGGRPFVGRIGSSGGRHLDVTPLTPREDIIELLKPGGLSSPMRSWQTMLGAARGEPDRQMELLEATFCFDEKGQARLDAFLAALPEAARVNFRSGKSVVAPVFDAWLWRGNRPRGYSPRRDVPVPGDPSRADSYFRVTYESGETREDRFSFKRYADGWRYGPLSESDADQLLAFIDPTTGLPKQPSP
jgi:RNA polymerase sigma factor (sigma-70 family)